MSKVVMSWGDRFAVIDHYRPTDEKICQVFGLDAGELEMARMMLKTGTFKVNKSLDVSKYSSLFSDNSEVQVITAVTPGAISKKGSATTHTMPESASKRVRPPQKRGRKGDKISRALQSVTTTKVPVEEFCKQHDVSLAVLRQSKRFIEKLPPDVQATIGKINVRQDGSKVLMIWKD